jgi:Glycosyl hydrolase family 76
MTSDHNPMSRRTFAKLAGVLTGAAAGGLAGASAAHAAPPAPSALPTPTAEASKRAAASNAALERYFAVDHGLYTETYPKTGDNAYSYEWPFSQAMIAAIDLAGMPSGGSYAKTARARLKALEYYWNPTPARGPAHYASYVVPPLGQGGDAFYDDNEWDALAKLQWYYETGDEASLLRAKEIFELVVYGWDTDATHPHPGGVFWTQAPWSQDRNTVSNGPGAEVGLHLYEITREARYREWAERMIDWVDSGLLSPDNGLYWDNIHIDGSIDKTQWSYNQGVMLGAKALLYRATGDAGALADAKAIADAALAFYGAQMDDGRTRYFSQPARFNAILFANLLLLASIARDPRYLAAMNTYEADARRLYLDARSGLFRFPDGEHPNAVTLLEQSAMVRIQAMQAWKPSNWGKLT